MRFGEAVHFQGQTNNCRKAKAARLGDMGVACRTLTEDLAQGGLILLERLDTLISENLPVGCAVVDLRDLWKGGQQQPYTDSCKPPSV